MDINTVAENLTELLTNSVNMTSAYYDLFLNLTPMDVTFKQYNDNNELVDVTLPNRAKDRQICLSGEVPPEGVVAGNVGECYVDTVRQEVWFKINNSGENTGWVLALTEGSISPLLANYVPKSRTVNGKALYSDITLNAADVSALSNNTRYGYSLDMSGVNLSLKDQSGNNLSTIAVSAIGANRDLSNLTDTGNKKLVPDQSSASGKWLTSNGSTSSWASIPDTYHPDVLSFQWCDHLLNNPSWLRADTFSWQPGSTYSTAYNKLVAEFNNRTGLYSWGTSDSWVGTTSETPAVGDDVYGGIPSVIVGQITAVTDTSITVNGSTYDRYATMDGGFLEGTSGNIVRFYRTNTSNFKIATADQETNVLNKYQLDGIAWYYILDTDNQRFKLPRVIGNHGQLIDSKVNEAAGYRVYQDGYCEQWGSATYSSGWAEATFSKFFRDTNYSLSDCFTGTQLSSGGQFYAGGTKTESGFKIRRVAGNSANLSTTCDWKASGYLAEGEYLTSVKDQSIANKKYLYFYVGEYTQTAIEQTAGLNSELFNGKLDISTYNSDKKYTTQNITGTSTTVPAVYLKECYINPNKPTEGYIVWSNGYCEQWGVITQNVLITFDKKYSNTNYTISSTAIYSDTTSAPGYDAVGIYSITESGMKIGSKVWGSYKFSWRAGGYLAEGEY